LHETSNILQLIKDLFKKGNFRIKAELGYFVGPQRTVKITTLGKLLSREPWLKKRIIHFRKGLHLFGEHKGPPKWLTGRVYTYFLGDCTILLGPFADMS